MDELHVRSLAEQHRQQLDRASAHAAQRQALSNSKIFDRDIAGMMQRLDEETQCYCKAYNEGFGDTKLTWNNHTHGVNVEVENGNGRDAARLHVDLVWREFCQTSIHAGRASGHLEVALQVVDGQLVMSLDGQRADEASVITTMLDRFTTMLADAETLEM